MYDYEVYYWLNKKEQHDKLFCDYRMNPNFFKWDPFQNIYIRIYKTPKNYIKPISNNDPRLLYYLKKNA